MDTGDVILLAGGVLLVLGVMWILLRIDNHKTRRFVEQLMEDAKAGRLPKGTREDAPNGVITLSDDGFTVRPAHGQTSVIRWEEVAEIRAYKADLFTVDLICWGFRVTGRQDFFEVHEEMAGFDMLVEAAEARFASGLDEDWWQKVAFPAFAQNVTVVWPKEKALEGVPHVQPPITDDKT